MLCVATAAANIGGSRQRAAAVTTYGFALVVTAGYACLCRLRHGRNEREVSRALCAMEQDADSRRSTVMEVRYPCNRPNFGAILCEP